MANTQAFAPGATITLSVTGSSGTGSIASNANSLEIQNAGSVIVFVRVGASASVGSAVITDYPILPGMSKIITKAYGADTIAAIGASAGPTTVYVTSGEGM